jgi:hypothetical protein
MIDAAVKAWQKMMFFDHKLYPSMERLININSALTQLWNPINLRNPEDVDDTFSETSIRTRVTWYKVPESIYNIMTHL